MVFLFVGVCVCVYNVFVLLWVNHMAPVLCVNAVQRVISFVHVQVTWPGNVYDVTMTMLCVVSALLILNDRA